MAQRVAQVVMPAGNPSGADQLTPQARTMLVHGLNSLGSEGWDERDCGVMLIRMTLARIGRTWDELLIQAAAPQPTRRLAQPIQQGR